jgi:hypothetical protein
MRVRTILMRLRLRSLERTRLIAEAVLAKVISPELHPKRSAILPDALPFV